MYKIKNTELDFESRIFHLHKIFYSAFYARKMPAATTLSTVFIAQACPVRWTKQACAINTVSLCSLETATFLAKVFRILIQVLSDLAASSTKSCTKFCRHIQHPSLSEEKDKPVEPERLKLKIERYRSLE